MKRLLPCWILPFGLILLLGSPINIHSIPASQQTASCNFGECSRWHILLLPLLTEDFTQLPLLKAIVRSMLTGCRWYFPEQIRIELFTRNGTFLLIKDPILLPELDQMLDQLKYPAPIYQREFSQRHGQTQWAVNQAVDRMNETGTDEDVDSDEGGSSSKSSSEEDEEEERRRGRFIFVITDFDPAENEDGSRFLKELDQQLTQIGIYFRNIRLHFDGHKQTQIIPGGGGHVREDITNVSSNIVRVAIVEPGSGFDAFAAIRPCPQLSDEEKIREYSYVQHFYYENWLLRNPRGAIIGFALFICAICCAIAAYAFHLWEQNRAKRQLRNKAAQQQAAGQAD